MVPPGGIENGLNLVTRRDAVRRNLDPGTQHHPIFIALGAIHHVDRPCAFLEPSPEIAKIGIDPECT